MSGGHTIILIDEARRDRAHRFIDAAPDNFVVDIREPSRTNPQNAKMWAMLSEISAAKPEGFDVNPPEIWKEIFLDGLGRECRTTTGLDGRPIIIGRSSSKLTKAEFAMLIELIIAFAAKKGIELSDPIVTDERMR